MKKRKVGREESRRAAKIRKEFQKRAEDLKTLQEQRAELVQSMKDLADQTETEQRAMVTSRVDV